MTDTLPTLTELEQALMSNEPDTVKQLRDQLLGSECASTLPADKVVPPITSDAGYNRLQLLLENFGPKCLSCKDGSGATVVHLTAQNCATEVALDLILQQSQGEENELDALGCFRAKDDEGWTPVFYAAMNNSIVALKWLVRKLGSECLKATTDNKYTPLFVCLCKQRSADCAKFIVDELGDSCLHQLGPEDCNVLHVAAQNRKSNEVLKWLIGKVSPKFLTVRGNGGNTPVHLAALTQGESSMELIKDAIGQPMFTLEGQEDLLVVHVAALNTITNSALAWCIRELGPECLLAKDPRGLTPVHFAARSQGGLFMEMIVEALDESCLTLEAGIDGVTAVHYAAMNETGNSALRWIVGRLGPDCLKLPDADYITPAHLVARFQDVDSLEFIKDCLGTDAFAWPARSSWTMAHFAAMNKKRSALLSWIASEVGPHCLLVPDDNGNTPNEISPCK